MSAMMSEPAQPRWKTPELALIAGCLITMIGFEVRSGFGLFLQPKTAIPTVGPWRSISSPGVVACRAPVFSPTASAQPVC